MITKFIIKEEVWHFHAVKNFSATFSYSSKNCGIFIQTRWSYLIAESIFWRFSLSLFILQEWAIGMDDNTFPLCNKTAFRLSCELSMKRRHCFTSYSCACQLTKPLISYSMRVQSLNHIQKIFFLAVTLLIKCCVAIEAIFFLQTWG